MTPLALKIEVLCITLADLTMQQTNGLRNNIPAIYSCCCNDSSSVRQVSLNCVNGFWPFTA
jgi:hypothetical protein